MRRTQNNFNLAKENYHTAIDNLRLAERIEKKNIIKFFEGVIGSFQLTQAQQQLYQAQQNKIQSMRTVIIEKTNLENILNNKN
jgi:outer membrane protein TolC